MKVEIRLSNILVQTKRSIPLIDLQASYASISEELLRAAEEVLSSGHYINGPQVQAFEEELAQYLNVPYAVGVANGTDALMLTLDALGVGPGDEVITSPFTFFASAEVISRVGATPVFVDVNPDTYLIDTKCIERAITPRTKAIIPVHIFGQMADMDAVNDIAMRHGLHVVEDACQALGADYNGKQAGSLGTAGCFSFFPTKNLGGFGDGGIVVTHDAELARTIRMLRVHGSNPKYYHARVGYNSRLDELQASLLRVKLRRLNEWTDVRRQKVKQYEEGLSQLPITLPTELDYGKHAYHLYIIETDQREQLMAHLKEQGIDSGVYYPVPLHLQEVYRPLEYSEGDLPHAEQASVRCMALPLFPELTQQDQQYIIDAVTQFFKGRDK